MSGLNDQLSHLGIRTDRLDEQKLIGAEVHPVRFVQFPVWFDKHAVHLLIVRVRLAHDVVHGQNRAGSAVNLKMSPASPPLALGSKPHRGSLPDDVF